MDGRSYLVAHGEATVVDRRPPEVRHVRDVEQIDQVQPSVQDEPARLPVLGHKVRIAPPGESKGVDEEKSKYDDDAA